MPMDMPPDVDLVNEQSSEQVRYISPGPMQEFDSVDPAFIAWAEERGIDLDRDDAEELVRAEYERTAEAKTIDMYGVEMPDVFGQEFERLWYTFNYSVYKGRKEHGFPPANPNPEDGFYSKADAQREIDEAHAMQRETSDRMQALRERMRAERGNAD